MKTDYKEQPLHLDPGSIHSFSSRHSKFAFNLMLFKSASPRISQLNHCSRLWTTSAHHVCGQSNEVNCGVISWRPFIAENLTKFLHKNQNGIPTLPHCQKFLFWMPRIIAKGKSTAKSVNFLSLCLLFNVSDLFIWTSFISTESLMHFDIIFHSVIVSLLWSCTASVSLTQSTAEERQVEWNYSRWQQPLFFWKKKWKTSSEMTSDCSETSFRQNTDTRSDTFRHALLSINRIVSEWPPWCFFVTFCNSNLTRSDLVTYTHHFQHGAGANWCNPTQCHSKTWISNMYSICFCVCVFVFALVFVTASVQSRLQICHFGSSLWLN